MSATDFLRAKAEHRKLSMVTCYDYTFARLLSETQVDGILVGDSAGMVMHGHPSTLSVSVELIRIHTEESGQSPDCNGGEDNQTKSLTAEIAAGQYVAQLVLAAAEKFFQIGRSRARTLRPRAPWPLAAAAAASAPGSPGTSAAALIAPWHWAVSSFAGIKAGGLFRFAGVIGEPSWRYNAPRERAARRRMALTTLIAQRSALRVRVGKPAR